MLSSLFLLGLSLAIAAPPPPPLRDVLTHRPAPLEQSLQAELVPLGFSPKGHLAVIRVPPDEAVGCFLWEFQIINLVTDAIVESERWQDETCEQIASLEALWAARGTAFQAAMDKHGVQHARPVTLQSFPLSRRGDTVTAFLLPGPPVALSGDDPGVEAPLQVQVRSTRLGEKTVGTVSIQYRYEMPWAWGQEVVGYLQSPFEERIVVVVRGVQRGWEGLPHIETVTLFGADLQKGF